MESKKVIVLGGGVAGLSSAHELIERGFQVEVFEKQKLIPGGKARSVPVPESAKDGRRPLPGEHGFRFFPGFYRHVTDTMSRIPYKNNKKGVLDNLVAAKTVMIARYGMPAIVALNEFPTSVEDLELLINGLVGKDTGLTSDDIKTFTHKVWQLMTTCGRRRQEEYERISWWDFLEADSQSEAYRTFFVKGLTRSLVACKAEEASTKTVGDIFLQLFFNTVNPFAATDTDRLLNGPTNDVWINPWLEYLKSKGVVYHFDRQLNHINMSGIEVSSVEIISGSGDKTVHSADYYISAMPVERFAEYLTDDVVKADPTLDALHQLKNSVSWMNGLQFYLNEQTDINQGHVIYADSEWAITSVSQKQFWGEHVDLSQFGNGEVKDVLSIDISDWFAKGSNGKQACECTREEIIAECWNQMKKSLNVEGQTILKDELLVEVYLDRDIKFKPDNPTDVLQFVNIQAENPEMIDWDMIFKARESNQNCINTEPLLINTVNSWSLRPEAHTAIPNLFIASDYVRTHTDLATMEGANEAARRAVNCIIDISNSKSKNCEIWDLHEPSMLKVMRRKDNNRYFNGLPWKEFHPWYIKVMIFLIKLAGKIYKLFK